MSYQRYDSAPQPGADQWAGGGHPPSAGPPPTPEPWTRRVWQRFRSWPTWAQLAVGFLAVVVVVGPFVQPDDEDEPQAATTTTAAAQPTTTPTPATAEPPVSGQQVVDAVTAAGLPVVNPRDNTAGTCDPANAEMLACTEVLTTDLFTVRVWATPADAQRWADAGAADPPIVLRGQTTVDLHEGGTTPAYDRAAYEAAIGTLAG